MGFSAAWRQRLNAGLHPEFIVTIVVGHSMQQWSRYDHPSSLNGSILATSYPRAVDADNVTFFPTLVEELSVSEGIDPIRRVFEETQVDIVLSADANVPIDILDTAGTTMLWGQVDLWMPGLSLSEAIPLVVGRVTSGSYDRRTGRTKLQLSDGDPVREVRYPPGDMKLTRAMYHDIPVTVEGIYPRTVILGRWDYPVQCPQVDGKRTLFYICDHVLTKAPTSVEVNGVSTNLPYRIVTRRHPGPILNALETQPYATLIEFLYPVELTAPFVTCTGGIGLDVSVHPAVLLLENYGEYRIEDGSRHALNSLAIDSSILVTASDNVLTLVKERILRQTPLIGGFRRGLFTVTDLNTVPLTTALVTGVNLFDSDDTGPSQTELASVYNAIEITYQRNVFTQSLVDMSRQMYTLDMHNADADLASKLQRSEYLYGRRQLNMDFADVIARDFNVPAVIPQVANQVLGLSAFQHQTYTYPCSMELGLTMPFNVTTTLTDTRRDLAARPVRFIRREVRRHQVSTTFLSEDT